MSGEGEEALQGDIHKQLSENDLTVNAYFEDLGLDWKILEGKTILDLGAGLARFAQAAKQRDINVTSVDLHPGWHTETGVIPASIPYFVADARKPLPFPKESFNLIVARASIHSMVEVQEDMEAILGEVKRLLKPDGEFRFGTGNINMRPVRQVEWDKWFDLLDRVQNHQEITPEEDAWGAKTWPRYEQELKEQEELKCLSHEERIKQLEARTLENLRKIDHTITAHPITRTLKGWGERGEKDVQINSTYYIFKKKAQ